MNLSYGRKRDESLLEYEEGKISPLGRKGMSFSCSMKRDEEYEEGKISSTRV